MLKSKFRTPEEQARYLSELKAWLKEAHDTPVEQMDAFFTNRIGCYEEVHNAHWSEEYAAIADYFEDGLQTLLDIGCGTGLELRSIFRRFPNVRVTGVDLSETMLRKLRENYPEQRIELIPADYFTVPLQEGSFDAALSFETLHHFPQGKKRAIYEKLFAALKMGGYYLECDYTACCDEEEALCLREYEYRRNQCGIPEDAFVHIDIPLTLEKQVALMRGAGFSSVEVLYQNAGTVLYKAVKGK